MVALFISRAAQDLREPITAIQEGDNMRMYSLIELLLLVAAFYTVLKVDATTTKIWITLPCLIIVLVIEKIRKNQTDEKEASERLKNFSSAELRRKMQAENAEQHYRS